MPQKCRPKDILMRSERVEVGCRGPALGVCSGCLDAGLLLRFAKRKAKRDLRTPRLDLRTSPFMSPPE